MRYILIIKTSLSWQPGLQTDWQYHEKQNTKMDPLENVMGQERYVEIKVLKECPATVLLKILKP